MADNEVDMVNHPPHYGAHPSGIECIQVTRDMSFSVGNAVKYVWRADLKNGREDLEKAQWYLKDAIAHEALTFCGVDSFAWKRLLDAVSEAEPDPNRLTFLRAIRRGELHIALGLVDVMLAAVA